MSAISEGYARWAKVEAAGVSALYYDWATGIAVDDEIGDRVAALPQSKRQPNLVFAAARRAGVPLVPYTDARAAFLERWNDLVGVALARSTQTNEARRCAVLLPILAELEGPIALLEVGVAAGLCLFPDKYSYCYDTVDGPVDLDPESGRSEVLLSCELNGCAAPARLPDVVWRGGIDLNPLDVVDPDALAWLETLVWPEHDERRAILHAAARIVASERPVLMRGDLNASLSTLVAQVPSGTRLVIFHSAVLSYLHAEARAEFVERVSALDAVWISNEGKSVLPQVAARLPADVENGTVLAVGGQPVAIVGPHGQFFHAL